MSYEYKEKIKEDLEYSLDGVSIDYYSSEELIHKQKVKELDHVYAQAAKADEYEAKVEAFDEIVEEYESIMKEVRNRKFKVTSDVTLLGVKVEKVIKKYERGGSDE